MDTIIHNKKHIISRYVYRIGCAYLERFETEWLKLKNRFHNINLHEHITMPNHFHGILEIVPVGVPLVGTHDNKGQPQGFVPTIEIVGTQNEKNKMVVDIMGAFKSITTVEYTRGVKELNWTPFHGKLWQHNYYEHIIRDGNDYERIAKYIQDNPANWRDDRLSMEISYHTSDKDRV